MANHLLKSANTAQEIAGNLARSHRETCWTSAIKLEELPLFVIAVDSRRYLIDEQQVLPTRFSIYNWAIRVWRRNRGDDNLTYSLDVLCH